MTSSSTTAAGGGSSTSTIIAEMVTGAHVLKVEGYSGTKGLGVSERIESGTFDVGGHRWCLRFFPDGFSEETADWIFVDLCLDAAAHLGRAEVKAGFKLCLLDQAGEPVLPYTGTCREMHSFSRASPSWGYSNFIRKEDLKSSPHFKDDSFRIRCDITVLQEIRTEKTEPSLMVPPSDLHRHLGALLASQKVGDVKFKVGREVFVAHRNVLGARSPIFEAEIARQMEKSRAHVWINDMEPGVFKAFLQFIYTDSLPEIDDDGNISMAQHLLVAANKYGMERLKLMCEVMLHSNINANTVVSTLVLAEQHGCHRLKEACLKFISYPRNFKVVMARDDFGHLLRSCPSLLKELSAIIPA